MDRRELKNGVSNIDALDTEGGDIAAMLNALPRVDAPENFEFRVRARIAEGSTSRATLFPFLKIAAPLSLVLLIFAFVVFYGLLPARVEVPLVVDSARNETISTQPQTELVTPSPPLRTESVPPNDRSPEVVPDSSHIAAAKPAAIRRTAGPDVTKPLQGGSRDFSLNSARPKLPPGFESVEPRNLNANTNTASGDVPVRNVLGILGITVDIASGELKVRSVVENSIAARAGVRAADVIEEIDGQPTKVDSMVKGGAKTFTVRRDGKQIALTLSH